ncbi:DNA-binding transcriptional LysR family regulator [Oceanisphaera litoralis]|uniref:LysR family transcriptional regulator n=1 Tax=Oceanisphaera litoralis TaxID=225144 RepID=UPI00195637D0|nr:LysR family transcriptional regulator [Oceanisphaera litoralis]MBM7456622.1 DNA-binding transcriptional LysR family regulator [Oceanisphaera litoralis]
MDFRQLRYFVAIVEEGSISAASRRVHIAQPALTRQIHALETDLGSSLFERGAKGISLTVTGRALYEEAKQLLATRERVIARIGSLSQGVIGKVTVGVTVAHLWVPGIKRVLSGFRERYPRVALEVFPLLSGPQSEKLKDGSIDAGFLYMEDNRPDYLKVRKFHRDNLVLAVPEQSPLVSAPPETVAQLSRYNFVWGPRSSSPVYYDRLLAYMHQLGFYPRVVQLGADNVTILSLVAAGLGISIVPGDCKWISPPGVRFIEMPELALCDMSVSFAWNTHNHSPALQNFINTVLECSQDESVGG